MFAVARTAADAVAAFEALEVGVDGVLDWVSGLRERVGIPPSLAAAGLDGFDIGRAAALSAVDPSGATNPIALTEADYAALLEQACR